MSVYPLLAVTMPVIFSGSGAGIGYAIYKDNNDVKVRNYAMGVGAVLGGVVGLGASFLLIAIGADAERSDEIRRENAEKSHQEGIKRMFSSRKQSKVSNIEGFQMSNNPMYQAANNRRE